MRIVIITDKTSWINSYLDDLIKDLKKIDHNFEICNVHEHKDEKYYGTISLILSYSKILSRTYLSKFKNNIVVHASDLPKGKGMSPMTWQVLDGLNSIPVTIFEASEECDAGNYYAKTKIELDGYELVNELRSKLYLTTKKLVLDYVKRYPCESIPQVGEETFYNRRGPNDSLLDTSKSLDELFNLLRVCDNENYPAYFIKNGNKYLIKIEKEKLN